MKCLTCSTEFESKRSSAKYCSAKCRKLAFQQVSVPQPHENAKDNQVGTLSDTVTKEQLDDPNFRATPAQIKAFTQVDIEAYYTSTRFRPVQYGPSNSPNPPHMRGKQSERTTNSV